MSRPMTFRKIDGSWFGPLARVLLLACCLAGLPNLALASANSLFIEAFRAWEAAEQASSPLERLKLLEVCQAKLDEIVREHPNSDVAVQIVTRGKVGEFDLSLVTPALEDARAEVEETDSTDFSEHIYRLIEDFQRHDFEAAWDRYLNALTFHAQFYPSDDAGREIMAWRIEREIGQGNINGSVDLVHATLLANEELFAGFDYDGDTYLYKYLIEALLHTGREDVVLDIISDLDGGIRRGAIDAAILFQIRHRGQEFTRTLLNKYHSEIEDSSEISTITSALMARNWDVLVQAMLSEVKNRDTKAKVRIAMADAYLDRGDMDKAEATASGTEVKARYINWFTKSRYVSLLFRLAGAFGEVGDFDKADYFFERASRLDPPEESYSRAQAVGALAKMGRVEEARKLSGLTGPTENSKPSSLSAIYGQMSRSAYFKNLPTDAALREISRFEDYLKAEDDGLFYFQYLTHHQQYDLVMNTLIEMWNDSSLSDESLDKLLDYISIYLDDEKRQEYFVDWLQELNRIRPQLDTSLHLLDKNATAEQIRVGLLVLDSRKNLSYPEIEYIKLAHLARLSDALTANERYSLVAEALMKASNILENDDSSTRPFNASAWISWRVLAYELRAIALGPKSPDYWRTWPR
jgi:hypothetical protein